MIKKILTVPNPLLRQKSKPVAKKDKKIKQLVKDLIDTAQAAENPKSVGLSAIQIGQAVRVFLIKKEKKFVPLINPQITWHSAKMFRKILEKEKLFFEGCLSVPGYFGFVDRPCAIKLEWQDLAGEIHREKFENKFSAYVQHELDHLDGILFVDRILSQKGKIYQIEKDKEGKEGLVEVEIE